MSAAEFSPFDSADIEPGQQITAADLDFYSLVRRHGHDGKIIFNGRRAMLFEVEAIGMLRHQLIAGLGPEAAKGILFRLGYIQGYQDADSLAAAYHWATETDWLAAGWAISKLAGMVSVETHQLEFERQTGHFLMSGLWRNSYEAETHRHYVGPGAAPVCWTLAGYASGYTSRFLGQKLLAQETSCAGQGHAHCAWEIRPVAAWGSLADPVFAAALDTVDLADPLSLTAPRPGPKKNAAPTAPTEDQNLLRCLIDNLPEQIYVKDRQSRFLLANEATRRVLGAKTTAEIVGKTDFDFSPPELARQYFADEQNLFTSGRPMLEHEEPLFDHESGTTRWLYTTKALFYDHTGQPAGLVGLNQDITERKRNEAKLARMATELQTVAEVSTAAAAITTPAQLLQEVVDLTKARFELYHAHIYLLDDSGRTLKLAAGAGETGQKMVAQGWSIPLSAEHSLVARTARTRAGIIVNNVHAEPDFMPNPLLPLTRSELAVPLLARGNLLGVLDVQSEQVGRFTEEDIRLKTILAAQVAVALQNSHQYQQTQQALVQTEAMYTASQSISMAQSQEQLIEALLKHISRENLDRIVIAIKVNRPDELVTVEVRGVWDRLGQESRFMNNRFTEQQFPLLRTLKPQETLLVNNVAADTQLDPLSKATFVALEVKSLAVIPFSAGGQVEGWLLLETTQAARTFTPEQIQPYTTLVIQAAVVLESQRILEETRRRASREQILREVTGRIRNSADVNSVMRTAAKEVGLALGRPAFVTLREGQDGPGVGDE
jgi:PAS domain S-box-containing protein